MAGVMVKLTVWRGEGEMEGSGKGRELKVKAREQSEGKGDMVTVRVMWEEVIESQGAKG